MKLQLSDDAIGGKNGCVFKSESTSIVHQVTSDFVFAKRKEKRGETERGNVTKKLQ